MMRRSTSARLMTRFKRSPWHCTTSVRVRPRSKPWSAHLGTQKLRSVPSFCPGMSFHFPDTALTANNGRPSHAAGESVFDVLFQDVPGSSFPL